MIDIGNSIMYKKKFYSTETSQQIVERLQNLQHQPNSFLNQNNQQICVTHIEQNHFELFLYPKWLFFTRLNLKIRGKIGETEQQHRVITLYIMPLVKQFLLYTAVAFLTYFLIYQQLPSLFFFLGILFAGLCLYLLAFFNIDEQLFADLNFKSQL